MAVKLTSEGGRVVWAWMVAVSLMAGNAGRAGPAGHGEMQLTSSAFSDGSVIPARHTCDDKDLSPPLKWTGVPAGTRSLALIVDDPDAPAGTWVHWVLFDMAATVHELHEGAAKDTVLPDGALQGRNDFGRIGYGGPCPPHGTAHRYFFKLYALDKRLELKPGVTKKDVEQAMETHILAQGQLMGTYKRK